MGAIHFSLDPKLLTFLRQQLPLEVFVETGTFKGDTLNLAKGRFAERYSVEMSPHYFEEARKRFAGEDNVHLFLGDSPSFLAQHQFPGRAVLYWLDAHWCQASQTAGQASQSPLLGELSAVRTLHPQSVLLIDDARLYLCPPPQPHVCGDWPDCHSVITALLALSASHRLMVLDDVMVFYPAGIAEAMSEFAHRNGADWLSIHNELRGFRERRQRRFPRPEFFRHRWRKLFRRPDRHVAD